MADGTKIVTYQPEQVVLKNQMAILINSEVNEFELEVSALGSGLLRQSNLRERKKDRRKIKP